MQRLDGKVAIITGAASGIGAATARLFAEEGARLVLGDIKAERLQAVAAEIGGDCVAVSGDVAPADHVAALVQTAVDRFDGLDILYNNAGTARPERTIAETPEADWDRTLAVNLKSVWLGMKYAHAPLKARGGGAILSTASISGMIGMRFQGAYGASKAGILELTRVCAAEYARDRIRVNCICPGGIVTGLTRPMGDDATVAAAFARLHPLGRAGYGEDIARAALWLASDESSLMTGQSLVVDDGWTGIDARWDLLKARPEAGA